VKSAANRDTEVAEVAARDKALGPPDCTFQRRYLVAHARGNLMQVAHDEAEGLRREQIAVNSETLRSAMLMKIGLTLPRSVFAIDFTDAVLDKLVVLVADDYLTSRRQLSVRAA
jgi:hypothetical protein